MDEYISKKAAIEKIKEIAEQNYQGRYANIGMTHAAEIIDHLPAADVAPVIHAKRIKTKKHRWKTSSNGEIDFCAWDSGYCNGPQCLDCGEYFQ